MFAIDTVNFERVISPISANCGIYLLLVFDGFGILLGDVFWGIGPGAPIKLNPP